MLVPSDIIAAKLRVDTLEVRGVSFRGTAHELFGGPRQDAFAFATDDEWVVLIVSDGIGSCEHSHHGSATAVEAIVTAIESGEVSPAEGAGVLTAAADAGRELAETLNVPSNSLSATLTVAAVERNPQDDGSRHVIIHFVGDSPAVVLEPANAKWTYLTPTEDGPSNVVRSWVPDRASEYVSFGLTVPAGAVLVLASDGFTTPLGDGSGPLGIDLASRWGSGARDLLPFLVDLSFNAYHDDKTVVALWNPQSVAAGVDGSRALKDDVDA
ncbi:protein phosphatase 2C domain-containing protein [Gordonia sp. HS-NH1]|uniref:protein phosphatase 2C domain-containing protein n=1 Tax=Gordonia sp. HS-NH1 TaxID=1435068 RepID=UPI000A504607|nr:protein phosphatase 2C domain-containing protein [Gordonia sp. HS-NH1]